MALNSKSRWPQGCPFPIPGLEYVLLECMSPSSLQTLSATNKQLRQLVLGHVTRMHIRCGRDVTELSSWTRLTCLKISGAQAGNDFIARLVPGHMPALQSLDLSHSSITPAAAQQLSQANWPLLTTLTLNGALARAPSRYREITPAVQHIAAGRWPKLTALDISSNYLTVEAFEELVKADWPALQKLDLREYPWPNPLLRVLSMLAQAWTGLQELDLSGTDHSEFDFAQQAATWPRLRSLSLHGNKHQPNPRCLSLTGVAWPSLTHLDLREKRLSRQTYECLAQTSLPQLTHLELGRTPHPDDRDNWYGSLINWHSTLESDLANLPHAMPLWKQLRHLHVTYCTPTELAELVMAPDQHLDVLHATCFVDAIYARHGVQAGPEADSWPEKVTLHMHAPLDSTFSQTLASGCWPISSLHILLGERCASEALEQFSQCDLPYMRTFELKICHVTANMLHSVFEGISMASWPALRHITVRHEAPTSRVGDTHIALLAAGKWPLLECIHLSGSDISTRGIQQLALGNWPFLSSVSLPRNNLKVQLRDDLRPLFAKWPGLGVST